MKKLAKSAAMMAFAFAALVVSCQKEMQAPADVSEEAFEAKDCFVASFDQSTKTTIDGNRQVKWAEDDSIAVNGVIYKITAILNTDSTKAEFKKCDSKPTPAAPFTAVFPAEWCTADGKDIDVPQTITRKDDKDFSMPMKAVTTNRTMVFSNTFGVLAVKVEKDVLTENKVDSITVLKNENDTVRVLVCNGAQITAPEGNIFYVPMAEGNYDSLIVYANSHEMFSRNNKDIEIKAGSLYAFNYQVSLKGINIDEQITDTVLIIPGKDTTFNVVFTPADATNKNVVWSSSDTTIAKVDANGKIRGVGTDTIKVTVTSKEGGYTDSRIVIVKIPVDSVVFAQQSLDVELDSCRALSATVYPSNASYPAITWTSLNTEKLEVNNAGMITAKDTGAVKIVATADGKADTCDVNIICKVTSVKIDTAAISPVITLTKYNSLTLKTTVGPEKATTSTKLKWESLNPSKVGVDSTGKVTAVDVTADSVKLVASLSDDPDICDSIFVKVSYAQRIEVSSEYVLTPDYIYASSKGEDGGAVCIKMGAVVNGSNVKFMGNYSTTEGGAIYNNGTLNLDGAMFCCDTAVCKGGAICNYGTLNLSGGVTFEGNSCEDGGAVYNGNGCMINLKDTVKLAGTSDTLYNDEATINWDLTGTSKGILVGWDKFVNNNGTLRITLGSYGICDYVIATGATDFDGKNKFVISNEQGSALVPELIVNGNDAELIPEMVDCSLTTDSQGNLIFKVFMP